MIKIINLKKLEIDDCGLKTFPTEFGNLNNLKELNLNSNRFNKDNNILLVLENLSNLKVLDLINCDLTPDMKD